PAKVLLDPYARAIEGDVIYGPQVLAHDADDPTAPCDLDSAPFVPRCVVLDTGFDWGDDAPPSPSRDERVIYEAHVRELTMRLPGVPEHLRGTYAGLAHP